MTTAPMPTRERERPAVSTATSRSAARGGTREALIAGAMADEEGDQHADHERGDDGVGLSTTPPAGRSMPKAVNAP